MAASDSTSRKSGPAGTLATCAHCGGAFTRRGSGSGMFKHCSLECALWGRVDKSGGPEACWPWTGARHKGYGMIGIARKKHGTHRVAYALATGDPGDLHVCHACDNPPCCNPAHLFLGTHQDNMRDLVAKGRALKSEETKRRISEALTGHSVSAETREKLRITSTGKKLSAEAVEKAASVHRGVTRSPEIRARMSEAAKRRVARLGGVIVPRASSAA